MVNRLSARYAMLPSLAKKNVSQYRVSIVILVLTRPILLLRSVASGQRPAVARLARPVLSIPGSRAINGRCQFVQAAASTLAGALITQIVSMV